MVNIDLMPFAQMLTEFRERQTMTKTELARRLKVSLGYVQHVEAERRKPFSIDKCREIASILSLDENESKSLIEAAIRERAKDETLQWIEQQKSDVRLVPVISWIHANQFGDIEDPFPLGTSDEFVPTTAKGENVFALKIKHDCMCAPEKKHSFCEGENIIVDPSLDISSGDFVVIRDAKAQEATFKQYIKRGKKVFLHPLNPKYKDIELDQTDSRYEIIGKVVGKYTKI